MIEPLFEYLSAGGDVGIWFVVWALFKLNSRLLVLETDFKNMKVSYGFEGEE